MRAIDIESTLSPTRLQRFAAEMGTTPQALRLYRWNAQVASAYWTPLHFLEVALRNAVHDAMTASMGTPFWFSDPNNQRKGAPWLYDFEREAVGKAADKVFTPITAGKVVAELHLGFWVGLTSGRYVPPNHSTGDPGGSDYHNVVWVKGGVAGKFGGAKNAVSSSSVWIVSAGSEIGSHTMST